MAYTIPSDNKTAGSPNHPADHNNIADMLTLLAGVNVKNTAYAGGATGNGVTDDTAAIQAAINAAAAATSTDGTGNAVYFPAGTYLISSVLTFSQDVILRGAGQNTSIIAQSSTSANGITISGATVQNVQIIDLQVAGPNSGTGVGINVTSDSGLNPATSLVLRNVIVVAFGSHGLQLEGPVVSTFDNVTSEDNGGRGWYIYGVNGNNPATSCTFISCYANNNALDSFYVFDCNYMSFNGCAVDGGGTGWVLGGCNNVVLTGCSAEDVAAAHSLDGTSFKITTDGTSGSQGVVLNGCYAIGGNAVQFWVTGSSKDITLVAPIENSPGGSATASIKTDSGTTSVIINPVVTTAVSYASSTAYTITSAGGTTH